MQLRNWPRGYSGLFFCGNAEDVEEIKDAEEAKDAEE